MLKRKTCLPEIGGLDMTQSVFFSNGKIVSEQQNLKYNGIMPYTSEKVLRELLCMNDASFSAGNNAVVVKVHSAKAIKGKLSKASTKAIRRKKR